MLCRHTGPFTLPCMPAPELFHYCWGLFAELVSVAVLPAFQTPLSQPDLAESFSKCEQANAWWDLSLQTVTFPERMFLGLFLASGLPLFKTGGTKPQIDEESSVLSEHLPISVSFIFPSLSEALLRALFAFQLLPNIVQMVLMSHHCRSFIF